MKLEQPQLTMLLSVGSRRSWNGDRVLSEKQQESEFEVKIEDFCAAGKSIFEAGITLVRRGLALPAPILWANWGEVNSSIYSSCNSSSSSCNSFSCNSSSSNSSSCNSSSSDSTYVFLIFLFLGLPHLHFPPASFKFSPASFPNITIVNCFARLRLWFGFASDSAFLSFWETQPKYQLRGGFI